MYTDFSFVNGLVKEWILENLDLGNSERNSRWLIVFVMVIWLLWKFYCSCVFNRGDEVLIYMVVFVRDRIQEVERIWERD